MTSIKSDKLKNMFIAGGVFVSKEYLYMDELNVFPVPDGDTGTNLNTTCIGATKDIEGLNTPDVGKLAKAYARSLLMNARGNSGVIMSQIFKGFVAPIKLGTEEVTIGDLIKCFEEAKITAYKAVTTPVEGTILTVIRVVAEKISTCSFDSIEKLFAFVVEEAEAILQKTPDFLPELKAVGVVDSGGYGLVCFLKGMNYGLKNNAIENIDEAYTPPPKKQKKSLIELWTDNNEGFGYCCEFLLRPNAKVNIFQENKEPFDINNFKIVLEKIGDSIVCVQDDEIVKVHIHTLDPGSLLSFGSKYGEFENVKIENMTLQFLQKNPGTTLDTFASKQKAFNKKTNEQKIIATVPSAALQKIFSDDLHVEKVINTENNVNPSIQDFLDSFKEVDSSRIFLVIDDTNVAMAAKEAIALIPKEVVKIQLVVCGDALQSYSRCLSFDPVASFSENKKRMTDDFKRASFCKISQSVKVVKYNHINVNKNDYIGIFGKKIVVSDASFNEVIKQSIDLLLKRVRKPKYVRVFVGRHTTAEMTRAIETYVMTNYDIKCELIKSDQKVFNYLLSTAW